MFDFGNDWLANSLLLIIPLILSLTVHEWAHARTAFHLGDDTAARMGRMTLNPFVHIDPIGTLILPLAGVPFGWAKPVPVAPQRFNRDVNMRTGMLLTAAAGPASNIVLAVLAGLIMGLSVRLAPGFVREHNEVLHLLIRLIQLNVILAVFNMLPIPPLDGSRVADGLMPRSLRPMWERFMGYAPILLVAVLVMPFVLGVSLLAWPVAMTERLIVMVIQVAAG